MKIVLLILGSLVFTQLALAYPLAGDRVQFQKADGSILELQNNGLDINNQFWLVQVTEGTLNNIEKWSVDDMPSQKEVLSVLQKCVQDSGISESIVVPAGKFETCKFSNESGGFTWIGDVPFSIVKVQTAKMQLELLTRN